MKRRFIGALADAAGVPVKTIRYYEETGLLPVPARTATGYRLHAPETAERLQFIKKAQGLGLSLRGIKEILDLADRGRCPCGHVQRLLRSRLGQLRRKIADLRSLERRLARATRRGCPPDVRPAGKAVCPTIERQSLRKHGAITE